MRTRTKALSGIVALLSLVALPEGVMAERWLLVDFGYDSSSNSFGTEYPTWNQVIQHPLYTEYVDPDGNPDHWGITDANNPPGHETAFFGVKGTAPIDFQKGHKIIATFYNANVYPIFPLARISFSDEDSPQGAGWDTPWNSLYSEQGSRAFGGGETAELVFNVTDSTNIAAPLALPTEGEHFLINLNLFHYNSTYGDVVLTKLELSDEADFTPPDPPANVEAVTVSTSEEAGENAVRLTWDAAVDPPGNGGYAAGVSRYYIYRNGELFDVISPEWAEHFGSSLQYVDASLTPNTPYVYEVVAIDRAVTGFHPNPAHPDVRFGNYSDPATASVMAPDWSAGGLLDPFTDLHYLGGFLLPDDGDWSYTRLGLTFFPGGNPDYDPETELPGSLYGMSNPANGIKIGEFSIPKPVLSEDTSDWNRAETIQPNVDIWPRVYDGNWEPPGALLPQSGIGHHPAANGVEEGVYYGLYNPYGGDQELPAHGYFDLDLTAGTGAWHVGGLPDSPEHVPFVFTAKLVFSVPPDWAAAHTGGRSLLCGLGWAVSGQGWPSGGPTLYAVAPWESGVLPGNGEFVTAVELLRYGTTNEEEHWMPNWNDCTDFRGAAWAESLPGLWA